MVIKIKVRLFLDSIFYKAPELLVSENVYNPVLSLVLDYASYMYVERQGFSSVNLEIWIIEDWIIKVLLYNTYLTRYINWGYLSCVC